MQKKRILVVDDEAVYAETFKRLLGQTGFYEVQVENHPREAVATAREFKPDLIVLDVIMPGLQGGQVMAQLQADPLLKDIPIVFMTSTIAGLEGADGVLMSAGCTYLSKPFNTQDMLKCLEKALAGRQLSPPEPV